MTDTAQELPAGWHTVRPCENRGCDQRVVEYREAGSKATLAAHVGDRIPESECTAPPFNPTDEDVRDSEDPQLLRRILTMGTRDLRQVELALANPACPADLVEKHLAQARSNSGTQSQIASWEYVLAGLAARSQHSNEDWQMLRASRIERVKVALATNPHAPATILNSLLTLSALAVRTGLARNPAVDVDKVIHATISRLASAPDDRREHRNAVRVISVALRDRPLTAGQRADILARLCDAQPQWDPAQMLPGDVSFLSYIAAERTPLPGDVLDWMIRRTWAAGWQAGAVYEVLRDLLGSRHPVPGDTLAWLYRQARERGASHWDARDRETAERLLRHPHCPPEVLLEACEHADTGIRAAAAANAACPDEGKALVVALGWHAHAHMEGNDV